MLTLERKQTRQSHLQMLTNSYKRLHADGNCWLLGGCKEGVVVNELAASEKNRSANK